MAPNFLCADHSTNPQEPYSLDVVKSFILEDSNPMEYIFPHICRMVQQILFCDYIDEAHELLLAISTFDAKWAKTHRKYEPLGLNCSNLARVSEWFFESHKELPRPTDLADPFTTWDGYHTPWDLYNSYCGPEAALKLSDDTEQQSFDSHQWRVTDDPTLIAKCCRFLAAPPGPGLYPSLEDSKEALEAAQKLYAQPQVPYTEWRPFPGDEPRHYQIVGRPLAIELALRAGDIKAAVDILELAVNIDGLQQSDCAPHNSLQVPGIYSILPILAEKGLEANPFYINKADARLLVDGYKDAMESRIKNGQHNPLAKIPWKKLLNRLAKAAWEVNSESYKKQGVKNAQDILFPPATKAEIAEAEKSVGKLPDDFKQMVRISNGFKGGWHFLSGGLAGIKGIGIGNSIEDYEPVLEEHGLKDEGVSGNVICVQPGAWCDGYRFCIVPHEAWAANNEEKIKKGQYICFPYTHWDDSRESYESVREFVVGCVQEVEQMVEKGEKVKHNGSDDGTEKGEGSDEGDDDREMTDVDE